MITADQLVLHVLGDYVLQSHWMAVNKTSRHWPAFAHALSYSLPFLWLGPSPLAFAVICGTHFLIDRYRLARYVVWAKNWLFSPVRERYPWKDCQATGNPPDSPIWLAGWLTIICDNVLHVGINGLALAYL